jgi:hypothetical protein
MVNLYSFIFMHWHNSKPNPTHKHKLSPIINYKLKFLKLRIYAHEMCYLYTFCTPYIYTHIWCETYAFRWVSHQMWVCVHCTMCVQKFYKSLLCPFKTDVTFKIIIRLKFNRSINNNFKSHINFRTQKSYGYSF